MVRFHLNTIKGTAAQIGAARLHYACYYMMRGCVDKDIATVIDYYPELIRAAIEVSEAAVEMARENTLKENELSSTN